MSSDENVASHNMVHKNNPQSFNDLLLQILQETQLKLDNMEKRMNEMVAQMKQNQEEMQSSPPPRTETEVSEHKKTSQASRTQTEKQKKQEIVSDLSADIKKIKPPKFVGSESGEDVETWLTKMEQYFKIRNFSKISKAI